MPPMAALLHPEVDVRVVKPLVKPPLVKVLDVHSFPVVRSEIFPPTQDQQELQQSSP